MLFVLSAALCLWCAADGVMTIHRTDYREWPERWERLASELEAYNDQVITIGLMDDYGAGMDYWRLKLPAIWDINVENMEENNAVVILKK